MTGFGCNAQVPAGDVGQKGAERVLTRAASDRTALAKGARTPGGRPPNIGGEACCLDTTTDLVHDSNGTICRLGLAVT